jgi:hypothetical protein
MQRRLEKRLARLEGRDPSSRNKMKKKKKKNKDGEEEGTEDEEDREESHELSGAHLAERFLGEVATENGEAELIRSGGKNEGGASTTVVGGVEYEGIPSPDRGGNRDKKSVLEIIQAQPELLKQMQTQPDVFLDALPPEIQHVLVREIQQQPELMDELLDLGKAVMVQMLEQHPEELLRTMQNPLALFRKAKTPWGLKKLIRELEENPMLVMKEEYRDDPEVFFLRMLQENPRILQLVTKEVSERKPHLLPLIKVLLGLHTEDDSSPSLSSSSSSSSSPFQEPKRLKQQIQNRMMRTVTKRLAKKLVNLDESEIGNRMMKKTGVDLEEQKRQMRAEMDNIRQYFLSDDVKAWQAQYEQYLQNNPNKSQSDAEDAMFQVEDPD